MSWFEKNYEKVVLGGAVVAALGLAYLGFSKMGSVEETFATTLKGSGGNKTEVASADAIPKTQQSMKLDRTVRQALDGDRPVDLFTGIALFVSRDAPEDPIDLLEDSDIHPPIPNTWWLKHNLDPGFADSPKRDPDGDGFSNLEEFEAKTDPTKEASIPELLAKLLYVRDESLVWVLRPGYGIDGKFPFNYEDGKGRTNKVRASEAIAADGMFFEKEPMKGRFKLLGSEVREEMDKKANYMKKVTIVRIEDQRPNKKGEIYELPSPLSDLRKKDFLKYDRNAVFSLQALGMGGSEFQVEERTEFKLPPETGKTTYKLVEVTPSSVKVEYTAADGNTKTVDIAKGATPNLDD